jgi:uncharacterized protein DUF6801
MRMLARRRTLAGAAAGAVVLAGPFAGPAAAEQATDTTLAYTCQFPTGPQPVTARIRATFPDQGGTVTAVSATITVPRVAVPDGTGSVAAVTRISLVADQNSAASADLTAPATPVPVDGDIVLDATGTPPAVPRRGPGTLTLLAGELTLSTVDVVACALDPGQDPRLATISVPEPGAKATTEPAPTTQPRAAGTAIPSPGRPDAPRPRVAAAPIPPEYGNIAVPPGGKPGCAFVTGYSTIRKLGASLLVVPALANLAVVPPKVDGVLLKADNPADLVGGRIPPLTGSFLTFGFVPIRAKMDLVQDGPINIHTEGRRQAPFTFTVTTIAKLAARIYDVTVNGVPLDVGQNCRTEKPIEMVLTGGTPDYVNVLRGGPQAGSIDIPAFTGCGVTENLDPLFTGTVSGPGNRVKTIQGSVCSPPDQAHTFCPPVGPQLPPPGSF